MITRHTARLTSLVISHLPSSRPCVSRGLLRAFAKEKISKKTQKQTKVVEQKDDDFFLESKQTLETKNQNNREDLLGEVNMTQNTMLKDEL